MGLDISVNKLIERPENIEDKYYFRLIDDDGNYKSRFPEWTKKFETPVTEHWYDWEKFKEQTGIDIKNTEWCSEEYGEKGNILNVWDLNYGARPQLEDFQNGTTEDGTPEYDVDEYLKRSEEHMIKINLDEVPLYDKTVTVIFYDEIGYQRKGLNSKFYQDYRGGKIGYYVWDKKGLQRYKKDYCDRAHEYVYPNGEKSGQIVRPKLDFQRNIIDNFTEGECVVTFDW